MRPVPSPQRRIDTDLSTPSGYAGADAPVDNTEVVDRLADAVGMEFRRYLVGTALVVALSACSEAATGAAPAQAIKQAGSTSGTSPPPTSHWADVLRRLDRRRETAYALADPRSLSSVYAHGSTALRRDRGVLQAYHEREITLTGVQFELLAVHLIDRERRRVRLRVVDQLRRPSARTVEGEVLLPQDQQSRWVILLRRESQDWRIAGVRRLAG